MGSVKSTSEQRRICCEIRTLCSGGPSPSVQQRNHHNPRNRKVTMTSQHTRPAQLVDANLFDVAGPIRINFSRSSITGRPLFSYQDAELNLNFQGDEIDIL